MKTFMKITGVILVLVMVFATVASFSARTITGILGDADKDGDITILDATRIQRVLAALYIDADKTVATLGDIDGNGLDILDATRIQRHLVGFKSEYPIGKQQSFEIADPTTAPTDPPTQEPTKKDQYELPLVD